MSQTKFISFPPKEKSCEQTVLTHCLQSGSGLWYKSCYDPERQDQIIYLGKYHIDGEYQDVFAGYAGNNSLSLFLGKKGSEFD